MADPELTQSREDFIRLQQRAVADRNRILRRMRSLITPFGRAFSEAIKEEGANYERILARYLLRVMQDQNAVLALLQHVDFTSAPMRHRFDDLVSLLIQGVFVTQYVPALAPNVIPIPLANVNANLRGGYATAISQAVAGMNEDTLLGLIQRARNRRVHRNGLMLLANLAATEEVTRRVISASGRTNRLINTLAVGITGGTAVATFTGGVVTILYFAGVPMPLPLVNALALPGTTPRNLCATLAQTASQLGTGFVVEHMNRGECGCACIRQARGWRRPVITIFLYYLFLILLQILLNWILPSAPDEWHKK
jgi:hypothetical protein